MMGGRCPGDADRTLHPTRATDPYSIGQWLGVHGEGCPELAAEAGCEDVLSGIVGGGRSIT